MGNRGAIYLISIPPFFVAVITDMVLVKYVHESVWSYKGMSAKSMIWQGESFTIVNSKTEDGNAKIIL